MPPRRPASSPPLDEPSSKRERAPWDDDQTLEDLDPELAAEMASINRISTEWPSDWDDDEEDEEDEEAWLRENEAGSDEGEDEEEGSSDHPSLLNSEDERAEEAAERARRAGKKIRLRDSRGLVSLLTDPPSPPPKEGEEDQYGSDWTEENSEEETMRMDAVNKARRERGEPEIQPGDDW